jgi:hypothetical protein
LQGAKADLSLSLSLRKERGAAVLANHVANLPKVLKLARFKIRTANSLTLEPQVLQFGRTLANVFVYAATQRQPRAAAGIRSVGIN